MVGGTGEGRVSIKGAFIHIPKDWELPGSIFKHLDSCRCYIRPGDVFAGAVKAPTNGTIHDGPKPTNPGRR